jgi:hypothetical protein
VITKYYPFGRFPQKTLYALAELLPRSREGTPGWTVRREVEAAGFKFDSESSILANPADPRTAKVFDPTIRGHTDQFILKFRKPK